MKRKYKVVGPHTVAGHSPGDTFESDDLRMDLNVSSGALEVVSQAKLACPACAEQKSRPPKFDTYEELLAHYTEEHAGLVPPGKEE